MPDTPLSPIGGRPLRASCYEVPLQRCWAQPPEDLSVVHDAAAAVAAATATAAETTEVAAAEVAVPRKGAAVAGAPPVDTPRFGDAAVKPAGVTTYVAPPARLAS